MRSMPAQQSSGEAVNAQATRHGHEHGGERDKARTREAENPKNGPASGPEKIRETREIGGPKGPEPTRYGDWEKKGQCIDF